jgi:flagellar basal-body rod protein FlgG
MWTSLRIATLGVLAQQQTLDVASNNIANADTVGFKRQRAEVAVVPPDDTALDIGDGAGRDVDGQRVDGGRAVLDGIVTTTHSGPALLTGNPMDFMIGGEGFIEVRVGDGQSRYTREGTLRLNADGALVTASGAFVQPPLTIAGSARELFLIPDGTIMGKLGANEAEVLGRIQLSRFVNPEGLERAGDNLLAATAASGPPITGTPGQAGLGTLIPGSVEASNVDVADELVRVLQAQRAYQVNLRALRTADEMIQVANDLRR